METIEEKTERIKRFGMTESERVKLSKSKSKNILMLLAQVQHLEENNEKLKYGLDCIASKMVTRDEAAEIADLTLHATTLRSRSKNE